jgi:hypothetical protein
VLPRTITAGRVLMHNHITHGRGWGCGINGFRAWSDVKPPPGFVLCPCGWAGLKHYARRDHVAAWRDPTDRRRMQRWVRAEERSWAALDLVEATNKAPVRRGSVF